MKSERALAPKREIEYIGYLPEGSKPRDKQLRNILDLAQQRVVLQIHVVVKNKLVGKRVRITKQDDDQQRSGCDIDRLVLDAWGKLYFLVRGCDRCALSLFARGNAHHLGLPYPGGLEKSEEKVTHRESLWVIFDELG